MFESEETTKLLSDYHSTKQEEAQMQDLIDIIENYEGPQQDNSFCPDQEIKDKNDRLTGTSLNEGSATSKPSKSADFQAKPPSVPKTVRNMKADRFADSSRTLHNNVSTKRNIIDCQNLNNSLKMRQGQTDKIFLQDGSSNHQQSPVMISEISKSLEATRLLHGGKPLLAMPLASVNQILQDDSEYLKAKPEGQKKRHKSKQVTGQLLQAYFPNIVKKKSGAEQDDYASLHGQIYLQNQIPGTHKRSKSKKSKGSLNNKLSSKENSNMAIENLVLLHDQFGMNNQTDPAFTLVESGIVPFQMGSNNNKYAQMAMSKNELSASAIKKGYNMIASNMISEEAVSRSTVVRRNSMQGNQSMTKGQKLPPIVSGNNIGLSRKIQGQCQSSPPLNGTSQSDISDDGKVGQSTVQRKKLDRLSSQLDQTNNKQSNESYHEHNGAHSQPNRNRKTLVDLSARRSSYDEYQDRLNDSASERELLVPTDSDSQKLKATALQYQRSEIQNSSYFNMESKVNPQISGGEVVVNLYNINDSDEEGLDIDFKGQISDAKNERKTDFESKNLERLKEMQEKRKQEQQIIEESRKKMQKKQEKLKNIILKEAAVYKAKKAERMAQIIEEQRIIELKNQNPNGKEQKTREQTSPGKPVQIQKRVSVTSPQARDPPKPEEEQKLAEEQAEEKRKFEMMRKYYRNRHHTFLAALVEQKKKAEEEQKIVQEIEAKKKAKAREKILGDPNKIKSKLFETKQEQAQEYEDKQSGAILALSNPSSNKARKRKDEGLERDRSLTTLAGTFSLYSEQNPYQRSKSGKSKSILGVRVDSSNSQARRKKGGKSRSQSRKKDQAKSATNFMDRNRTLTPKNNVTKQMPESGLHQELVVDAKTKLMLDENREQEILKEAAERKARAEQIRARQQKQLDQIKLKKEAEVKKIEDEKQRKEQILKAAREQVLAQYEAYKNQPSLREQQDSRLQARKKAEQDDTSPKRVLPVEMAPVAMKAIQNFLERNITNNQIFLNITDMKEWRKKHRVDDATKVFIVTGGYGDVKRALKKRGWVENKDKDSVCFDLKWTLKTKDIDVGKLEDNQIVNHFAKATSITTKVGLTHSLKNLIWFNNVDIDTFYPRCFDLGIEEEMQDFIQEFKSVKAQCVLKTYVREMLEAYENDKQITNPITSASVNSKLLKVAIKVCSKRTRELDELIDDPNGFENLVSDAEWKILAADEMTEEDLANKKHSDWIRKNDMKHNRPKTKKKAQKPQSRKQKVPGEEDKEADDNSDDYAEDDGDFEQEEDEEQKRTEAAIAKLSQTYPLFKQANELLKILKEKYPQFSIDGERNIWICKPAGSSRGRGIVLYRNLVQILDLCKQKETQYICQKYIENTLIVKNRKFDIRQWVLVTSWNPLTVWLYAEPYIRFPASDFTFENLCNRYAHLSNNSVAKNLKKVNNMYTIEGNMWMLSDFQDWLQEEYGYDVWDDVLVDKIKSIVINSLESVQDMFESSNKGQMFELFGYDIMIDDELNCWLIEVNSSPAMDYSTAVTERLVKLVLEDTVKVVVDYANASQKKKPKIDTGLYECIYRATRIVDKPLNSFGLNLEVHGKGIPAKNLNKW